MAITFAQQKRKQQYLLLVFAGLVLLILGIIWWGFLREVPQAAPVTAPARPPEIQIDFQALSSPFLQEAEEFPHIPPFTPVATGEQIGRENPFLPYSPAAKPSQ